MEQVETSGATAAAGEGGLTAALGRRTAALASSAASLAGVVVLSTFVVPVWRRARGRDCR